jgi:hypothetical protein
VPSKREPVYHRQFAESATADSIVTGAISLAAFASAGEGLTSTQRKNLADLAVWWVTGAAGKYSTRYRSSGVLALPDEGVWGQLVHEHVFTRRTLVTELLVAAADQLEAILRSAVACVVTKEEHRRLSPFDKTHTGWDRYLAAGIDVYDMSDRSPFIQGGRFVSPAPDGTAA